MGSYLNFKFHRFFLIFILLFSIVGCDQATKIIARDVLKNSHAISYLGNSVVLEHAENPGAFMSLGSNMNSNLRFWIFTVIVAVFLLAAFFFLLKKTNLNKEATIGLSLVIAGGIGNLVDRVLYGHVTDFINIGLGQNLRTGIFNFADVAIVIGVILLALSNWLPVRKSSIRHF